MGSPGGGGFALPKIPGAAGAACCVVPGWVYVVRCGLAASLQSPAARCLFRVPIPARRRPLLTSEPRAASFLCALRKEIKQFFESLTHPYVFIHSFLPEVSFLL